MRNHATLLMDHVFRALEPRTTVRRYAGDTAADHDVANFQRQCARDEALRERLRQEQQDEPRHEQWEDRYARDVGVRRYGEL